MAITNESKNNGIQCSLVQRDLVSKATSCREHGYPRQLNAVYQKILHISTIRKCTYFGFSERFHVGLANRPIGSYKSISGCKDEERNDSVVSGPRHRAHSFHGGASQAPPLLRHHSSHHRLYGPPFHRLLHPSHLRRPPLHHLPPSPSHPAATPAASVLGNCFAFVKTNAPNAAAALAQISHYAAVKALVIDLFCTSAMEAASSLRIPVHYFSTSGAAVLALCCHFPELHRQTTSSFRDMAGVELRVPGIAAALKAVNMPEPMLDRNDSAYWDMLEFCTQIPRATGILVNSFPELEPDAVNAVAQGACFPNAASAPPVFYIGPLIAQPQHSDVATDSTQECLSWLDKQPSKSVVFLCFGSRGSFSVPQLKEIANGLENSGHRFLWVVKKPPQDHGTKHAVDSTGDFDLESVLPSGFMERTSGRGLVVRSWAPQVEVLSRDSVGGFVSHCGWNSVLEAVVAGVPMVAWPLYAEQHVNRHVMVDDMKVAVAVEQRDEDGFVTAEEVEKSLREVMHSPHIRETSLKLKNIALAAPPFPSPSTSLTHPSGATSPPLPSLAPPRRASPTASPSLNPPSRAPPPPPPPSTQPKWHRPSLNPPRRAAPTPSTSLTHSCRAASPPPPPSPHRDEPPHPLNLLTHPRRVTPPLPSSSSLTPP
ncbi:hypothetical protein Fmac_010292 [Flemingia macrophylla]|uniref:UDP-glycosyltransferases domain-containing protein n=1 Tax=Flemingia macrophylla TaxID=520843 RepID=A0ABD1MJ55_9FABA